MTITIIQGSPRKKGNTAAVLAYFERYAAVNHTIECIHITRYVVKGCMGCWVCQRTLDKPGCVHRDDGNMILEKLIHSDLIVYASPVYVWGFTSQLKALLDRQCSLVKYTTRDEIHLLEGKKAVLLTTCGGPEEKNADIIKQIFIREMEYLRCSIAGIYVLADCSELSDLEERAAKTAGQMIEDLSMM